MSKMYFLPFRPAFDSAGITVPGSQHWFTLAGTNTPSAPFTDATLATHLENPVISNGIGYLPPVYMDPALSYRVRIYDAEAEVGVDTPLEEYDPYVPALATASVFGGSGFDGLFVNAGLLVVPTGTDMVSTTGYASLDVGGANYVYDAAVDAAYVVANPRSSFLSANGRGFRLSGEQEITPQMLGWVSGDPGPAIQAAFDAGHKIVTLNYANYPFASKITLPAYGTLLSFEKAVITKGANIDLFDMSAQGCCLQGLNIQGAGATYTGRGAYLSAGANSYDQRIIDCDLLDFNGYALEFVGADAGQRFRATNSNFCRTTVTNPAIKMPGASAEDIIAGNRTFTDCGTISGGQLFDLDGAANSGVVNSLMVSILTGAKTSRSRFVANRVAIGGGTQILDGYDNVVLGNVAAANLQLAATSQRNVVGPNSLIAGGIITDLSTATGDNMNFIYDGRGQSLVPTLGQTAGTPFALGNGTANVRIFRIGRLMIMFGDIQFNSTSTFGDNGGDLTIALPNPQNRTAVFEAVGSAIADIGGTQYDGIARIAQGDNKITIRNPGGGTGWKQNVPAAWTTTSRLRFSIMFEQG